MKQHVLPGGGPWRILDECSADRHNTYAASRGYDSTNAERCICPRALLEAVRTLKLNNERRKRILEQRVQLPNWWTGPWLILADCPATGHNTIRRVERPTDGLKCICPHGKALYAEYVKNRNEARVRERALVREGKLPTEAEKVKPAEVQQWRQYESRNLPRPNFHLGQGKCVHLSGAADVFAAAFDASSTGVTAAVLKQRARQICHACPMRQKCLEWVIQEEMKLGAPGAWGGVWGGLDPNERRRLMRG